VRLRRGLACSIIRTVEVVEALDKLPHPESREVPGFGFRASDFGFRFSVFSFRVSGFEFRFSGFGYPVTVVPRWSAPPANESCGAFISHTKGF
jgi:hypothetical protein